MSFLLSNIQALMRITRVQVTKNLRAFSQSSANFNAEQEIAAFENIKSNVIDINKNRKLIVPVETSIKYLNSEAYYKTYGTDPVWKQYRRNHKGQISPKKTRRTCIRNGMISAGNPCPICRDEYLIVDYRNTKLIKQFISEFNGETLSTNKTGVCRKQHWQLLIAIAKAKDYGLITIDIPFREYNYSDWYNLQTLKKNEYSK